jgi:hypothetical protein
MKSIEMVHEMVHFQEGVLSEYAFDEPPCHLQHNFCIVIHSFMTTLRDTLGGGGGGSGPTALRPQ